MTKRRAVLAAAGSYCIGRLAGAAESTRLPSGLSDAATSVLRFATAPGKGRMILVRDHPPNFATPIDVFTTPITPNDRFFVSYRIAPPTAEADLYTWRLKIDGDGVAKPLLLGMDALLDLPQADVVAVCESTGDRRGFITPPVSGLPWPDGGVGCALWRGPRLRDVLKPAGISDDAVEVWAEGDGAPPAPGVPLFQKSLPLATALDANTIVALAINNAPLPLLNGHPARLVIAGWAGAYWVKHLAQLTVSKSPLLNEWMSGTDRVPYQPGPKGLPFPSQVIGQSMPITRIPPNSIVADPLEGQEMERSGFTVRGIAWDGGAGINRVEVTLDGGKTWWEALLDQAIGPYAFRRFSLQTGWLSPGAYKVMSRATANDGERQKLVWQPNAGGYFNNVPRPIPVTVR